MFTKRNVVASLMVFSFIFPFLTQSAFISSKTNQDKSVYTEAGPLGPYDDEFNGPSLNPNWQLLYPNQSNLSLTASPGNLRIIGTNNDMWETCNNPKNLLLQQLPAANFEIQTKLTITPTVDYQQGGLLIFGDLDNYIKLDVVWNTIQKGLSVEFIMEENGVAINFPNWPWINISESNPAYLRIVKTNNRYAGYYSSDGITWKLIGAWNTSTISNPQVGIYALANRCNNVPSPDITVDFDYFHETDLHLINLPIIYR